MLSASNRWPSGISCVVQSFKGELAGVPLTACRRCVRTLCKLADAASIPGLSGASVAAYRVHDHLVTPHAMV